jgi:hypothetical protein
VVYKRDYAKEYRDYQGTPAQLHNQSLRHQARRKYEKAHGTLPDNVDVDHIHSLDKAGNPTNLGNLRAASQHENRSWRHRKGRGNPTYGK